MFKTFNKFLMLSGMCLDKKKSYLSTNIYLLGQSFDYKAYSAVFLRTSATFDNV